MTSIYVNACADGVLVEDVPAGPATLPVSVGEREARCLAALLALESYEVSRALGALFVAGVREGRREGRGQAAAA